MCGHKVTNVEKILLLRCKLRHISTFDRHDFDRFYARFAKVKCEGSEQHVQISNNKQKTRTNNMLKYIGVMLKIQMTVSQGQFLAS